MCGEFAKTWRNVKLNWKKKKVECKVFTCNTAAAKSLQSCNTQTWVLKFVRNILN